LPALLRKNRMVIGLRSALLGAAKQVFARASITREARAKRTLSRATCSGDLRGVSAAAEVAAQMPRIDVIDNRCMEVGS
jgi:hypothetical protein